MQSATLLFNQDRRLLKSSLSQNDIAVDKNVEINKQYLLRYLYLSVNEVPQST